MSASSGSVPSAWLTARESTAVTRPVEALMLTRSTSPPVALDPTMSLPTLANVTASSVCESISPEAALVEASA